MTLPRSLALVLGAASLLLVGCGKQESAGAPPVAVPSGAETVEVQPVDVGLELVTFEQWQSELESMKGSIVVVDLWATWCLPCIERFPKMVAMSEQYSSRGVRFVSLSLDDRDDESTVPQVTRFLQRNRADGMSNYLMNEIIPDAFEKLDLLGVPAVYIYDESGALRHRLTGDDPNNQFTDEDVARAIEEMVSQRGTQNAERGS